MKGCSLFHCTFDFDEYYRNIIFKINKYVIYLPYFMTTKTAWIMITMLLALETTTMKNISLFHYSFIIDDDCAAIIS